MTVAPGSIKTSIGKPSVVPPRLASLDFFPYLTEAGLLPELFHGKLGAYAIFDQAQTLQYVGFSRDVYLSLKQHLTRCPQQCHWVKLFEVSRPSRTVLEEIRQAWLAGQATIPVGNGAEESRWTQAIDAKPHMTAEEQAAYGAADDAAKPKLLKQLSRRIEALIKTELEARGVTESFRFDPKLKEQGLLTLK